MSASPTNDRKIPHQDTRPPKLADVPAFIEDIGRGWQERVISAPVLDGEPRLRRPTGTGYEPLCRGEL